MAPPQPAGTQTGWQWAPALPWDGSPEASVGTQTLQPACAIREVPRVQPGSLGFGPEVPMGAEVFLGRLPELSPFGTLAGEG